MPNLIETALNRLLDCFDVSDDPPTIEVMLDGERTLAEVTDETADTIHFAEEILNEELEDSPDYDNTTA